MAAVQYFAHNNQPKTGRQDRGGWDEMHNRVGMLVEHDSIVLGLLSTPKCSPSKYPKEGNVANNNVYAVCNNGNDKPLAEGHNDNNGPIADNNDKETLANDVNDKYIKGNNNDKYAKGKDDNKFCQGQ
jgi:hypothetical protein